MKISTSKLIRDQQQRWAELHKKPCDQDGYTLSLNYNLFKPLSPETESDFSRGRGDELGRSGTCGKMQALHSSSALVVNIFEYWWQSSKIQVIANLCGFEGRASAMRFEATHLTPANSTPHLDVEFTADNSEVLAIESKFTEHYQRHTRQTLKEKYMQSGIWDGLPECEKLAREIYDGRLNRSLFEYLDAPQLLKHILGLYNDCGDHFKLVYLWYHKPSPETEKHKQEIIRFKDRIDKRVSFRDMTHQELFENMKRLSNVDTHYVSYLAERYFS
jgi:hypothetical protein